MTITESDLLSLSSKELEESVAKLYSKMGYTSVHTKLKADRGKDVVAFNDDMLIFIEVKRYSNNSVSKEDVKNVIIGAYETHDDIPQIKNNRQVDKIVIATTADSVVNPGKNLLDRTQIEYRIMTRNSLIYNMNKYEVQIESS